MGTRADFFVGIGPDAEWIGSTSFDGYPDGWGKQPLKAKTEEEFRAAVDAMLADPEAMTTRVEEGWPWPWDDLRTTDYAYAWVPDRGVLVSSFGTSWVTAKQLKNDHDDKLPKLRADEVPNMKQRKMTKGGIMAKSGLLIVSAPKERP